MKTVNWADLKPTCLVQCVLQMKVMQVPAKEIRPYEPWGVILPTAARSCNTSVHWPDYQLSSATVTNWVWMYFFMRLFVSQIPAGAGIEHWTCGSYERTVVLVCTWLNGGTGGQARAASVIGKKENIHKIQIITLLLVMLYIAAYGSFNGSNLKWLCIQVMKYQFTVLCRS